ncbi:SDR family NAD(P)-dependent oxidoreductase [Hoeflea prorocentri]|uniref:SDR family NAD(P)-dependent oxidoreductase n=1 Tax=Hoeflea prorocentri TaxID=1922333 RepID=A0A9X3UGR1_9HYPH|nr:SDR family NAD(P)-dependent oxidoreductase [Hoeflea prorocentri]MCY6380513.1 SDR family NAD(P)-dependent oxidoreductase [Hoeflea prorocentri]MDA5398313.1 SDR family NAD(P)-dependent oxidoreductase [Hoeflea prorocentri]
MSNIALITGASSGIGAEFARYHASKGGDVILVARREEALNLLKAELEESSKISAHVHAADLGAAGAADQLYETVKTAGQQVNILINNAGFGGHGVHTERDLAEEMAMIDLNVKALVTLTYLFAKDMAARGGGKILNVGSTAGFMPGPLQSVYFATKAFVNSYSQAVDQELKSKGVSCSVLAPGYVETEFAQVASLEGTDLVKKGATAKEVAQFGYDAMMRGQLVSINDKQLSFLMNWMIPLLPRRTVLKMVNKMQAK